MIAYNTSFYFRSNNSNFLLKEYKCCCESQEDCCWNSCPANETIQPPDACGLDNIQNPAFHNISWHETEDGTYSVHAIQGLLIHNELKH